MDRVIIIDDSKNDQERYLQYLDAYSDLIEVKCFNNGVDAIECLSRLEDVRPSLIILDQQFFVKRTDQPDGVEPAKLFYRDEDGSIKVYPPETESKYVVEGRGTDNEQGFLILEKLKELSKANSRSLPEVMMCTVDKTSAARVFAMGAHHYVKSEVLASVRSIISVVERFLSISMTRPQDMLVEMGVPANCLDILSDSQKVYKRRWPEFVRAVMEQACEVCKGPTPSYKDVVTAKAIVEQDFTIEVLDPEEYWQLLKSKEAVSEGSELEDYFEDIWVFLFHYKDKLARDRTIILLKPYITDQLSLERGPGNILLLGSKDPYLATDKLLYIASDKSFKGWTSLAWYLNYTTEYLLKSETQSILTLWNTSNSGRPLLPTELILCSRTPINPYFLIDLGVHINPRFRGSDIKKFVLEADEVLPRFKEFRGSGQRYKQEEEFKAFVRTTLQEKYPKSWAIAGGSFVFRKYSDRHHEVDMVLVHQYGICICECKQSQHAKKAKSEQLKIQAKSGQLEMQKEAFEDFVRDLTPNFSATAKVKAFYILPEKEVRHEDEDRSFMSLLGEMDEQHSPTLDTEAIVRLAVTLERSFSSYRPTRIGTAIGGVEIQRYLGFRRGVYEYFGRGNSQNVFIRERRVKERTVEDFDYRSALVSLAEIYSYQSKLPMDGSGLLKPSRILFFNAGKEVPASNKSLDYIYELFPVGNAIEVYRLTERRDYTAMEKLSIARDLIDGLVALHNHGVIHGNITANSILIFEEQFNIHSRLDGLYKLVPYKTDLAKKDIEDLRRLLTHTSCRINKDDAGGDIFVKELLEFAEDQIQEMDRVRPLTYTAQALDGVWKTYLAFQGKQSMGGLTGDRPTVREVSSKNSDNGESPKKKPEVAPGRGVPHSRGTAQGKQPKGGLTEDSSKKKPEVVPRREVADKGGTAWLDMAKQAHPMNSVLVGTISEVYALALYMTTPSGFRCYYEGTKNAKLDFRREFRVGSTISARVLSYDQGGKRIKVEFIGSKPF